MLVGSGWAVGGRWGTLDACALVRWSTFEFFDASATTPCAWFHRSPLQQLFEGGRAVYGDAPIPTPFDDDRAGWHDDDDNRPPEVDAVDLPPPLVGATRTGRARVARGSAFAGPSHPIASRPVAVSDRASPGAPLHRRPPKLSSRDKRALRERPPAVPVGPGLLRSTLARGGPGAGAGPSPVASDDGWRREPGADEVREHYMDSKFSTSSGARVLTCQRA